MVKRSFFFKQLGGHLLKQKHEIFPLMVLVFPVFEVLTAVGATLLLGARKRLCGNNVLPHRH